MQEDQQPNKPKQPSIGWRIAGYVVIALLFLLAYYFFKSGAWTFFAPVRWSCM